MRHHLRPFFARFGSKLLTEVAPAALASMIGGILVSQWLGTEPKQPATVAIQPAGPEMLALLRDEHTLLTELVRKSTETQRAANQAADRDLEQLKNLAAERARTTQQKAAALAAKPPAKIMTQGSFMRRDGAQTGKLSQPEMRVAGEPLQLLDMKNTDPLQPRPPADLVAYQPAKETKPEVKAQAHSDEGFLRRNWRGAVTAVERVPNVLRGAADWLMGGEAVEKLQIIPRLPERNFLKVEM